MSKKLLESEREKMFGDLWALDFGAARKRGGPPVAATHIAVPYSASLSAEGVLEWRWHYTDDRSRRSTAMMPRKVDSRLWQKFAALADADDERIRRFAERWGPLRYEPASARLPVTETIGQWRHFAALARALLRCAAAISHGVRRLNEDWEALIEWTGFPLTKAPDDISALMTIAAALNFWYARSPFNSLVTLEQGTLILRPTSGSLLGILAVQLASRITGPDRKGRVCHHCKRFFIPKPKNQPRTGARSFCPPCRRAGKPAVYAMRDYRGRMQDH